MEGCLTSVLIISVVSTTRCRPDPVPILFLFNAADEQFPAQTSILYERRAASFLDAECRVMINWYLPEYLKRG
ncbi:MAG: DUF3786 domain-containing protein [Deltaproteobacteria bacterium]|nr:DUF3786 domain-containing protein [Deltaproteobacteria bacterium]